MNEEPKVRVRTILVLDDEGAILSAVRRILERQGYAVLTAATAHEALDVVGAHGGHVDLVICDLVLPGLGGREAANTLRGRWPNVKVLFMSGYSSHDSGRRDLQKAGEPFIGKPFEAGELVEAVRNLLPEEGS
jgi:CheY-like chemotaxis protein